MINLIESVIEIGKISAGNRLDDIYSKINIDNNENKENFIEEIVFPYKSSENKVKGDLKSVNKTNAVQVAKEYYWIGNPKANNPKIRVTSDNFLTVEAALPNLLRSLEDKDSDLFQKISWVVENYFEKNLDKEKKVLKIREDKIDTIHKINISKDVKLYTIRIGEELICKNKEYLNLINETFMPKDTDYHNGFCSNCMKNGKVTTNTKKLQFKYYITDKVSFASDFEFFDKNFCLCQECYRNAIEGENFLLKNFETKLGEDLIIIPRAIKASSTSEETLDYIFKFTRSSINGKVQDFSQFRQFIEDLEEKTNNSYILDLLFYKKDKQSFKIKHFVQDISLFRIKKIIEQLYYSNELIKNFNYTVNLSTFYNLLSKKDKEIAMNYIIKIFKGENINNGKLIFDFIQSEKNRIYLENIAKKDSYKQFLQMIKFLYFLRKMELFKYNNEVVSIMELKGNDKNIRPEDSLLQQMALSEQSESLVRLGFLLAQVSSAQYHSGLTKSPILEKVNFNGTDIKGVQRLVTIIEEKMKQYKLFYKNNTIDLQKLNFIIAKEAQRWNLNNNENVFYIMAGYSISRANSFKNDDGEIGEDVSEDEQVREEEN